MKINLSFPFCLLAIGGSIDAMAQSRNAIDKQLAASAKQVATTTTAAKQNTVVPWISLPSKNENAALPVQTSDLACEPMDRGELQKMIQAASIGTVKADWVEAIVDQESGRRPCAVSAKGAMGLMQLMPEVVSDAGGLDPFDPQENLRAGTRHFEGLLHRFKGDLRLALAAYNAGPAKVEALGDVPDYPETQAYVRAILQRIGPRTSD